MKTLVLSGFGTNCERETVYACRRAGADEVEVRHINAIYSQSTSERIDLDEYRFLVLIGGFLDGDDLGAARACANRFRYRAVPHGGTFLAALERYVERGRLVLGICNGFQLLVKLGLLPAMERNSEKKTGENGQGQRLSVGPNASGRFEDRWVRLAVDSRSPCIFTRGIPRLELPVRHGEGRVLGQTRKLLEQVVEQNLAPLAYAGAEGGATEEYPANPNGSPFGIASLCNPGGTVMGLMPHPEAFNHYTNHPQWTRRPFVEEDGDGLALFRNAYQYLRADDR